MLSYNKHFSSPLSLLLMPTSATNGGNSQHFFHVPWFFVSTRINCIAKSGLKFDYKRYSPLTQWLQHGQTEHRSNINPVSRQRLSAHIPSSQTRGNTGKTNNSPLPMLFPAPHTLAISNLATATACYIALKSVCFLQAVL